MIHGEGTRTRMSGRANQLPLRFRRPQLCAEMEAAAATREWTPVDVYWDPRYQSYFYAGAATPGQEEMQAGEFDLWEGLDERDPAAVPILLAPGSGSRRKGRRISWVMDEVPSADPAAVSVADGSRGFESFWTMWVLAMLVIVVLLVLALFILWLWGYLHERSRALHREATTSANQGHDTVDGGAPREVVNAITNDTSDEEEREVARRALDFVTNDTDIVENSAKARRRLRDVTDHPGSICLYTHRDNDIDSSEVADEVATLSGALHCDLLIRCCHILESDMTLLPETSRTYPPKSTPHHHVHASGRRDVADGQASRVLVAVRERESAFRRLLATGGRPAQDVFVHSAVLLAHSEGYEGLRLWWRESEVHDIVVHGFLRAVKRVAVALRKANFTLGFFVPYAAAAHAQPARYSARLRALDKVLDSTASLLLYPTTSALGNVSEWPSPSRMMGAGAALSASTRTSYGRSLCHLFLPTVAVSVVLENSTQSCDASAVQRVVAKGTFASHARLSKLCRSWDPSSWKVSRRRYYSYACGLGSGGKKGLVFQTPQQASRYRRKLLASTHSTCFGFVGGQGDLPRDCLSSPLFVSGLF